MRTFPVRLVEQVVGADTPMTITVPSAHRRRRAAQHLPSALFLCFSYAHVRRLRPERTTRRKPRAERSDALGRRSKNEFFPFPGSRRRSRRREPGNGKMVLGGTVPQGA